MQGGKLGWLPINPSNNQSVPRPFSANNQALVPISASVLMEGKVARVSVEAQA